MDSWIFRCQLVLTSNVLHSRSSCWRIQRIHRIRDSVPGKCSVLYIVEEISYICFIFNRLICEKQEYPWWVTLHVEFVKSIVGNLRNGKMRNGKMRNYSAKICCGKMRNALIVFRTRFHSFPFRSFAFRISRITHALPNLVVYQWLSGIWHAGDFDRRYRPKPKHPTKVFWCQCSVFWTFFLTWAKKPEDHQSAHMSGPEYLTPITPVDEQTTDINYYYYYQMFFKKCLKSW